MLGAIIGDIVGSTRERYNIKSEDFELLPERSSFTDDSVMTLAVAQWLMEDPTLSSGRLVECMQALGRRYPWAGYGGGFARWLAADNPRPYNSWGNGSAMRVSPVGMWATTLDEALRVATITAGVSHNHPEGIAGARALAACVWLWRNGSSRDEIRRYISSTFGYNLSVRLEDLRPTYTFDVSCRGSVPVAIMAFLQREDPVDVLRLAISMGGDSDTIGSMAYAVAAARGVPDHELDNACRRLMSDDLLDISDRFDAFVRISR